MGVSACSLVRYREILFLRIFCGTLGLGRVSTAQVGVFALLMAMGRFINIVGLWPYGQHFCIGTILLSTDCKCEEDITYIRHQGGGKYIFLFLFNFFFNNLKWMRLLLFLHLWSLALKYIKQVTTINSLVNLF